MKIRSLYCLVAFFALSACKKADDAASDAGPAGKTATSPGSSAKIKIMEDEAQKALAAKDYETVTADIYKLTQEKTLSQSEADKLKNLNANLLNAAQADDKAMEAYRNMSRALRGR